MTIVFDIGAANWGTETSMDKLIARFHPAILYAYDANPVWGESVWQEGRTTVIQRRQAAWTYDGHIRFYGSGTRGFVENTVSAGVGKTVECFDLAALIMDVRATDARKIVVKIDAEGAEWVLLPHLVAAGADVCIDLMLVERHGGADGDWNEMIDQLACDVEEWL